ncbi:MAG: glutathione peroxidase [Planctomycetes bacterium]|nr:glutathione peroxidase [Planctomycetota bacterium]
MSLVKLLALSVLLCSLGVAAAARADLPLAGTMKAIDGKDVDLGSYRGKVVLVVNVASRCGATPQYAGLQALYDKYKDQGFVVLGFPANDFGAQEPGSDEQIKAFCSSKYSVTFPMFAKITVKGADKPKLYRVLTESADPSGEIGWNFEKFLIGKDGAVAGRFKTRVAPDDPLLVTAVEAALAK